MTNPIHPPFDPPLLPPTAPAKPHPIDVALAALGEFAAELLTSNRHSRFAELQSVSVVALHVQRLRPAEGVDDVHLPDEDDVRFGDIGGPMMMANPAPRRHGAIRWNDGADFRASEEVLARRQRSLARKRRDSNSRRAARQLVARAHERIRNQRLDFARKFACTLFDQFDLVAHEDLEIARMVRGKFSKSIHDAAWGTFLRCLALKAEEAGRWAVPVDPRGTSQRCSGCRRSVFKELSEREHRCDGCGLVLHRDENAARNVLALGLSVEKLTEASEVVFGR